MICSTLVVAVFCRIIVPFRAFLASPSLCSALYPIAPVVSSSDPYPCPYRTVRPHPASHNRAIIPSEHYFHPYLFSSFYTISPSRPALYSYLRPRLVSKSFFAYLFLPKNDSEHLSYRAITHPPPPTLTSSSSLKRTLRASSSSLIRPIRTASRRR